MVTVKPGDYIPVLPYISVPNTTPNPTTQAPSSPAVSEVIGQPCSGAREKYMSLSLEHQMQAQSSYLSDVLEHDYKGYGRLPRKARIRLRQIQLDLARWSMACHDLRADLKDLQECIKEMDKPWYSQIFCEWFNRKDTDK